MKKTKYKLIHSILGFEYIDKERVHQVVIDENGRITFVDKMLNGIASFSSEWSFIQVDVS